MVVVAIVVVAVLALAALVVTLAIMSHRAYTQERKLWQGLRAAGLPVQGRVTSLLRSGTNYSRRGQAGQRLYAVQLRVAYDDANGMDRSTEVRTLIDEALLPLFATGGHPIHLLQDPTDPARVAIDRARTPLEVGTVGRPS